jgi:hypothetical protein
MPTHCHMELTNHRDFEVYEVENTQIRICSHLATNLPPPCEVLGEVSLNAITPCPSGESSIATVFSYHLRKKTLHQI